MTAPPLLTTPQDDFAPALLDPEHPLPADVTSHTTRHPVRRFAVYRNNVTVGLIEAVRARFPAIERIVGDDFFDAMVRTFVRAHPPRSPILAIYGDAFPDFVAGFPPAAEMPWLADVARLEAARTMAYHAADATPLDPAAFAALDPARLGAARIALHPSAVVVRSSWPLVTVWAMNSGEAPLGPVDFGVPEDALVLRPALTVVVHRLPPGTAVLLAALAAGDTLAEAAATASGATPGFDLTAALAVVVGTGITIGIAFDPEPQP